MKMPYVHPSHSRPTGTLNQRGLIAGFSLLLLMVAGGTSWWTWQTTTHSMFPAAVPSQIQSPPVGLPEPEVAQSQDAAPVGPVLGSPLPPATLPPVSTAPTVSPQQQELQPQIYWLKIEGPHIRLQPQPVALDAAVSPEQALMEGLINLLAHSETNDRDSAIPTGTRLLSLRVTAAGIYVNLSHEFRQGGGSSSMIHRVAQILYTATSLDPTAKVYLLVEGQMLDEQHPLGGEGLILRQPLTRQQFAADFSFS